MLLTLPPPLSAPFAPPLRTEQIRSPSLGRTERVLVYVPPGYTPDAGPYPLAVFLHGTPGAPEIFEDLGVPERLDALIAAGRIPPLVAAFPTGADDPRTDTEWADSEQEPSERWEDFVTSDLIQALQARYHLVNRRGGRAVAGLSMGAYGAINIALHHRLEFGVAESWSGYFTANTPSVLRTGSAAWRRYSPQLYVPALRPSLRARHPALSLYVGSRDGFAAENVRFHRLLVRLGVPHRFALVPGTGHSSALWASRLDDELLFMGDAFRRRG